MVSQRRSTSANFLVNLTHREKSEEFFRFAGRIIGDARHHFNPRHPADPSAGDIAHLDPCRWTIVEHVDDDIGIEKPFAHAAVDFFLGGLRSATPGHSPRS